MEEQMRNKVRNIWMVSVVVVLLSGCLVPNDKVENNETETIEVLESAEIKETEMLENSYNKQICGSKDTIRTEYGEEKTYYYYEIEKVFVKDSWPNAEVVNETLEQIYAEYEKFYQSNAECYSEDEEFLETPYDSLEFLEVTYVGEDYISILVNGVSQMGSAVSYSCMDGIIIDNQTGEEVEVSALLGVAEEVILEQVSIEMGMDETATWEDIDYYLTDSQIVFFYRMPNYWEDVVWER